MEKKRIAVVSGGFSGEAAVSMRSANMVMTHIDMEKYLPTQVVIEREKWVAIVGDQEVSIDKNDFSYQFDGEKNRFDGVFMIVHGTPGENGILQGYFHLMGIPCTTGDVLNMAITFNKKATTDALRNLGYAVAKSVMVRRNEVIDTDSIIEKVGLPCFVKPNNGGSSIGTSKVKQPEELEVAVLKALKEDNQALIESFVDGVEVTCGVIQYQGRVTALPLTEIVTENEFFDYQAKYEGASQEITPARLPEDISNEVRVLAARIYNDLKCAGMIRVDFIIQNNLPHVIEVNTVPGFSEASIIPQQAAVFGIDKTTLISTVIESCF
ncbi:MAG: D-alanine--D-alanine ligase [Bacteroidetes bacterium]|nr:D-alanine--D-alanine ligase [Bacteroidota bacterium]